MKKRFLLIVVLVYAGMPAIAEQGSSRPRIIVEELSVPGGSDYLESVSRVVTETISLTLRLTGTYDVVRPTSLDADSLESLETNRDDSIIGGRCYQKDSGEILFELHVIRGADGTNIHETVYQADSIFDVFDVADDATIELLETITAREVRFASLRVVPSDHSASYSVFLNGERVVDTRGVYSDDRILSGFYKLEVKQNRPLGRELIYEHTLELDPDLVQEVLLDVPLLLQSERDTLSGLTANIIPDRDPLFTELWAPANPGHYLSQVRDFTARGEFPAAAAVNAYYTDYREVQNRRAAAWNAGRGQQTLTIPVRNITVDGRLNDWQGVPKFLVDREPGSPDLGPQMVKWWRAALNSAGDRLYIVFQTHGGDIRRDLWYRFWFVRSGTELLGRENFQMDIRPSETMRSAVSQWTPELDRAIPFRLPAEIHIEGDTMEVAVNLQERALTEPFLTGFALMLGREPHTRFYFSLPHHHGFMDAIPLMVSPDVPIVTSPPRLSPGNDTLSRTVVGSLGSFLDKQVRSVEEYWRPVLTVSVTPEGESLHFVLNGPPGASEVAVTGPPGSGIRRYPLYEDNPLSFRQERGLYTNFLAEPRRVAVGDDYRFEITRYGHTFEVIASVRPFEVVQAQNIEIEYDSQTDEYIVSWDNAGTPVSHSVLFVDPGENRSLSPTPRSWIDPMDVDGGQTSARMTTRSLRGRREMIVHLRSVDRHGNASWASKEFNHDPRR